MQQLRKFLSLSFQGRLLLGKAFIVLLSIRLGLWILPFRWLNALVQWVMTKAHREGSSKLISAEQIVKSINTATHYLPGTAKCLARALAAQILLRHYGYVCTLNIGVAKHEGQQLIAHAWLERNGQVLIGGDYELSQLTPLPSIRFIH